MPLIASSALLKNQNDSIVTEIKFWDTYYYEVALQLLAHYPYKLILDMRGCYLSLSRNLQDLQPLLKVNKIQLEEIRLTFIHPEATPENYSAAAGDLAKELQSILTKVKRIRLEWTQCREVIAFDDFAELLPNAPDVYTKFKEYSFELEPIRDLNVDDPLIISINHIEEIANNFLNDGSISGIDCPKELEITLPFQQINPKILQILHRKTVTSFNFKSDSKILLSYIEAIADHPTLKQLNWTGIFYKESKFGRGEEVESYSKSQLIAIEESFLKCGLVNISLEDVNVVLLHAVLKGLARNTRGVLKKLEAKLSIKGQISMKSQDFDLLAYFNSCITILENNPQLTTFKIRGYLIKKCKLYYFNIRDFLNFQGLITQRNEYMAAIKVSQNIYITNNNEEIVASYVKPNGELDHKTIPSTSASLLPKSLSDSSEAGLHDFAVYNQVIELFGFPEEYKIVLKEKDMMRLRAALLKCRSLIDINLDLPEVEKQFFSDLININLIPNFLERENAFRSMILKSPLYKENLSIEQRRTLIPSLVSISAHKLSFYHRHNQLTLHQNSLTAEQWAKTSIDIKSLPKFSVEDGQTLKRKRVEGEDIISPLQKKFCN